MKHLPKIKRFILDFIELLYSFKLLLGVLCCSDYEWSFFLSLVLLSLEITTTIVWKEFDGHGPDPKTHAASTHLSKRMCIFDNQ